MPRPRPLAGWPPGRGPPGRCRSCSRRRSAAGTSMPTPRRASWPGRGWTRPGCRCSRSAPAGSWKRWTRAGGRRHLRTAGWRWPSSARRPPSAGRWVPSCCCGCSRSRESSGSSWRPSGWAGGCGRTPGSGRASSSSSAATRLSWCTSWAVPTWMPRRPRCSSVASWWPGRDGRGAVGRARDTNRSCWAGSCVGWPPASRSPLWSARPGSSSGSCAVPAGSGSVPAGPPSRRVGPSPGSRPPPWRAAAASAGSPLSARPAGCAPGSRRPISPPGCSRPCCRSPAARPGSPSCSR